MLGTHRVTLVLLLTHLAAFWGLKVQQFDEAESSEALDALFRVPEDFRGLAMIELEEHENTPTPPFSVCKFLLENSASTTSKTDSWSDIAKNIASVRAQLPEHVRSACDAFIKHNRNDIVSLLQIDDLEAALEAVADEADAQDQSSSVSSQPATVPSGPSQQDLFKKFWEEKGKYCGACLTITKKIQKWLSLNCTQTVISDRVVRMCGTMTGSLKEQCEASRIWIQEFVIKQVFSKLPLPNHCAYIGLCEKTMVIRALQNPVSMSDRQNALIQDIEGVQPNLIQEGDVVLQKPHDTPSTAPEITFDLSSGGVSYRDVDKSSGARLPKVFIDGSHAPADNLESTFASLLQTGESSPSAFDLSNPDDPHVLLHAQDEKSVNVPIMHHSLKQNAGMSINKQSFGLQGNHLPIETKFLKGCAACQFAIGALFEFMSNPRTIRTVLPAVKQACGNCNNPEEVQKCQDFVETHGVAFYQDVIRQGMPSKWCPRIELCEIQYFHPSPFVLSETYSKVKDSIKQVSDF